MEKPNIIVVRLKQIQSNVTSLLSPFVQELIAISMVEEAKDAVTSDGFLNWKEMHCILDADGRNVAMSHVNVVISLAPYLTHVWNTYKNMPSQEFWMRFCDYFNWTDNGKLFLHAFSALRNPKTEVATVLATLQLTAAIERSLGNVYLLRGKTLPFLLKELLSTPELKEIFGEKEMTLINVLLAIPTSLNLRNILWHGFVSPFEIDQRYGFFLIVLTMSLGLKLLNSGMKNISSRSFVSFEKTYVFQEAFPDIAKEELSQLNYIYKNSYAIPNHMQLYWVSLLQMYEEKRYGESIVLLIPQLETCLRVMFAALNNSPQCALTAEPKARYITLTEIFNEFLEDGRPNCFRKVLTESELGLLLDIFVYPEGPRVRDRLSHGEVDFFSIPQHLVKHLLCIAAVFCLKCMKNNDDILLKGDFICRLKICSLLYQPFFHPFSLFKDKLLQFIEDLKAWELCPVHVPEVYKTGEEIWPKHFHECVSFAISVYELSSSFNHGWQLFSEGLNDYKKYLKDCRILTIHQTKVKAEITVILRKVTFHGIKVSENVQHALMTYHTLWREKLLRSRQRITYSRLLKNVFKIHAGLRILLILLIGHAVSINNVSHWIEARKNVMFKILKSSQKYVENLDVMSGAKVNQWDESCKLTCEFIEKLSHHLKQFEESKFSP